MHTAQLNCLSLFVSLNRRDMKALDTDDDVSSDKKKLRLFIPKGAPSVEM